jgi:transcriptional regulator with XRE-family HTH domain
MARVSVPTNGDAIRRHRILAGWNSTPFARHAGITVSYLSKLEHGHCQASPAMLKRIADALGVTPGELIADETPAIA